MDLPKACRTVQARTVIVQTCTVTIHLHPGSQTAEFCSFRGSRSPQKPVATHVRQAHNRVPFTWFSCQKLCQDEELCVAAFTFLCLVLCVGTMRRLGENHIMEGHQHGSAASASNRMSWSFDQWSGYSKVFW